MQSVPIHMWISFLARSPEPILQHSPTSKRYEVIFADALQNQEGRGSIASVGDKVWTTCSNRKGLARCEHYVFLGLLQEDPQLSFQNVEGVRDLRVTMPGHFLRRGNREFCDPESRAHQVMGQARHFV